MKCPKCGTNNVEGAKFCEKCGESLIAPNGIICPKCGHKNKPTAQHCIECGTSLKQPEPTVTVKPALKAETPAKPKRKISPIIWVLAGILGVCVICAGIFLLRIVRIPAPPAPEQSILPEFVVSAWTGVYNFQTTGSFSLQSADTSSKYVEALFNCNEREKSPVYATTEVRIHDYIKWSAATKEQVEDFKKYIQFNVIIDGVKATFQGPYQYEITQIDGGYITPVLVALGSLPAGTHQIRTEISWSQQIYDGQDYYGPGSNMEKLIGNCTLVISQPSTGGAADQPPVVAQPAQWGGCERNTTKQECEAGGGTWFQSKAIDVAAEKYCICKNDPQEIALRDPAWCASQGGTWVDVLKECSFMNPCAQYTDQNSCTTKGGTWYSPGKYCWCIPFDKYKYQECSFPDTLFNGGMVYDSVTNRFRIEISQNVSFHTGSDYDVKVTKIGKQVGVLGCEVVTANKLSCSQNALEEFKTNWPGGELHLCRDVYCCHNFGLANIKTTAGNLFTLTGNCPASGDLTATIREWKSNGQITLEIKNESEWKVQAFSTDLKDAKGVDWTTLNCKQKPDYPKLMICTGAAVGKTGTGSLSFSYTGDSGNCSIQGLNFPIPCARPCQGTCCPQGYTCCECGCKFLGSSGSCSSLCS